MFALPISKPHFKSIIFYQNSPKTKLFFQKNAKFSSTGGPPPGPVPPAAGSFAPKPPASGGWRFCPQTPSLRGWGIRSQTPITAPLLRISGYALDSDADKTLV